MNNMQNYKILGVGHPRTGTGYTSKLLSSFGFSVGHETLQNDGIVAWQVMLSSKDFKNGIPWVYPKIDYDKINFETIIYNTRNPLNSIPSIVYTENPSLSDRKTIVDFSEASNPVEMAIISICTFDTLIKNKYKNLIQYRVEDEQEKLFNLLSKKYEINPNYNLPPSSYNSRKNRIGKIDYSVVRPKFQEMINNYCLEYGYPKIF